MGSRWGAGRGSDEHSAAVADLAAVACGYCGGAYAALTMGPSKARCPGWSPQCAHPPRPGTALGRLHKLRDPLTSSVRCYRVLKTQEVAL